MKGFVLCLLCVVSAQAFAGDPYVPNRIVFAYECKQATLEQPYFRCEIEPKEGRSLSGLKLHWITLPSDMSDAKREQADYLFNKIVLRYFQLGGRTFDVTAEKWPRNEVRGCSPLKSALGYTCTAWRKTADGFAEVR